MNIMWNQYSARQIREIIRAWPELPAFVTGGKSQIVAQAAAATKTPVKTLSVAPAKIQDLKGLPTKRQKHFGADGEIKFVEHRGLFVGFFGGRVVVTKRTREACAEYLLNVHGVRAAG